MPESMSQCTVLFADVCGSTRLYEMLGDAEALRTINQCLELVRSAVDEHRGRVVKTIGDEVMAAFSKIDDAADAAIDMQTNVAQQEFTPHFRLAIRVGFNFGPAIEVNGDVFGDSVNIAARMVALAKAEQVVLTAPTAAALALRLRSRVRQIDSLTVKGKLNDIDICELTWRDPEVELTMRNTRPRMLPARIRLRLGTLELGLDKTRPSCTLGRDPQNDLVIADLMASRMHARIERRRDKFVLIDESSNGTFVTIDGEPEVLLRREEMILRGAGRIRFGHASRGDVVEFIAAKAELADSGAEPLHPRQQ